VGLTSAGFCVPVAFPFIYITSLASKSRHLRKIFSVSPETCGNFIADIYCNMTPERRKYAVREASQRRPLLDNGCLGTFPQQRIGTRIIEEMMEMVISIRVVPKL
jgi:hypothetical protein